MLSFPPFEQIRELIQLARAEDMGPGNDDATSRLLMPEEMIAVGTLMQRGVGIACGLPMVEMICRSYDERLRVEQIPEGDGTAREDGVCRYCGLEMSLHGWVDTLEGGHIVCPGDWIIKGVKGEFYACKPDVFAETYEEVDGDGMPPTGS